jgi:hypothetical protein
MKTLFAAAAAAAAVAAFAAPAMAQTALGPISGYANLGYSYAHADPLNFSAVDARLGARTTYFGVEGQGTFGVNSDTETVLSGTTPVDVKLKLRHEFSGYAVGFLPLGVSGAELFARVGYGNTSIKGSALGSSIKEDGDSVNYGAGAQYFFNHGPNGVRADYTRFDYTDNGAGHADVWAISYVRKFGGQ